MALQYQGDDIYIWSTAESAKKVLTGAQILMQSDNLSLMSYKINS